jgi:hypothetical protein
MRHKHFNVIVAYAEGQTIQCETAAGEWADCKNPNFSEGLNYRVKPVTSTKKYRLALLGDGETTELVIINNENSEIFISRTPCFSRWLTPWVEYEV